MTENFGYTLSRPGGRVVGFKVFGFSEFEAEDTKGIWTSPLFHCPALGLRRASAGEICLVAVAQVDGSTVNRRLFATAASSSGPEAVTAWGAVLEAGDPMAHFGLGYTLLELGDLHGAYKHLRIYTEIARYSPWAWNYRGQAAQDLGDRSEARRCYRRAIRLEALQGESTDARERLAGLRAAES